MKPYKNIVHVPKKHRLHEAHVDCWRHYLAFLEAEKEAKKIGWKGTTESYVEAQKKVRKNVNKRNYISGRLPKFMYD